MPLQKRAAEDSDSTTSPARIALLLDEGWSLDPGEPAVTKADYPAASPRPRLLNAALVLHCGLGA